MGRWLVDIHGPHEHQSLLQPGLQLEMLDAFGGLEGERNGLYALERQKRDLETEKMGLIGDDAKYEQELDLLRFQMKEISQARLTADEEPALELEYRRAGNAAKLLQLSRTALELLGENETSVLSQAGIIGRTLQELKRVDPGAEAIMTLHEQSVSALRDLQAEISRYEEKVELDPQRLQQLEERLSLIQSLKRKYGGSVADVMAFGERATEKLKKLESREVELQRINTELGTLDGEIAKAGAILTEKRRKVIPQLSKAISRQLGDLGFVQSKFDVELKSGDEVAEGRTESASSLRRLRDCIEFQFSPNAGEPLRPLRAIASSGELARVMLAVKTVLATEDQVPVLVFDEVDANVGGETANAVGEKMQQIAKNRQVICITHLPQVAAPAATHFVASKEVKSGRTVSEIRILAKDERVGELARMLGGQSVAARRHAEEMLRT
jgi:DNA repair protein RecN (Recombination protein N)